MLFVGLGPHKNYSEFAIMDNDGRLIKHGRVENSLEDMNRFSNSLPPRPVNNFSLTLSSI